MNHNTTPKTRKPRHVAGRRTTPRQKKTQPRASTAHTMPITLSSPPRPSIPPEFTFDTPGPSEPVGQEGDPMDWMGAQLAKLIEEGKRALHKEVVVMSEAKEDEDDDGSGMWEDESHLAVSRSGSMRAHKRSRRSDVVSPPPSYISPQTTPRKKRFDSNYTSQRPHRLASPSRSGRADSIESTRSGNSSHQREDDSWQSPELRESMERARRRLLEQRRPVS